MHALHLSLCLSLFAVTATSQRKHTDKAMGVEVDIPSRWKQQKLVPDGRGVFARFRCNRVYATRSRDAFPILQLIEFSAHAKRQPKDTDPTRAAYRDYEHYLDRNHQGYKILSDESPPDTSSAFRTYRVRDGETIRIARIYTDGDRQVAVEFEVLEDAADKIKLEIKHSFASFHTIARDKPVSARDGQKQVSEGGREWDVNRKKWRDRGLQERHQIRHRIEEQQWKDASAAAQGDWKVSEKDDFLLVSNVDRRFARRVLAAASAFRRICDEQFDPISDEYARRTVLRVQESDSEYRSSRFASQDQGFELNDERSIVVEKIDGNSVTDLGSLYSEILDLYLQDKDVYFQRYMPRWFSTALHSFVIKAFPKNRKLEFRRESGEREAMAELKREKRILPLRELITLSDADYAEKIAEDPRYSYQATAFVRYLFGSGKKSKLMRTFFATYPVVVIKVSEKHAKTWNDAADIAALLKKDREAYEADLAAGKIEPPTAAEEPRKKADPAAVKRAQRRRLWRERRAAISKDVGASAFTFSKKQWKALDRAFRASLK